MKIVRINAMWCSGCLSMKKIWNKIVSEYPNLDMEVLDYDMDEEKVSKYNPGKILPICIFFKDGVEVKRLNGEKTREEIIEVIEEFKDE